jgi:hypothetical protein
MDDDDDDQGYAANDVKGVRSGGHASSGGSRHRPSREDNDESDQYNNGGMPADADDDTYRKDKSGRNYRSQDSDSDMYRNKHDTGNCSKEKVSFSSSSSSDPPPLPPPAKKTTVSNSQNQNGNIANVRGLSEGVRAISINGKDDFSANGHHSVTAVKTSSGQRAAPQEEDDDWM